MKRIALSLMTIAGVLALTVGLTGAWYSDTETENPNNVSSGTLAIEVNNNGSVGTFDATLGNINLAPGEESGWAALNIKNSGTTSFGWFGYFNLSGSTMLQDVVYIKEAKMEFLKPGGTVWEDEDHFISDGQGNGTYGAYYDALAANTPYNVVTLKAWNADNAMGAGAGVQMGALKPGYSYRMSYKLGMVGAAGNAYQNKTMVLGYQVVATQIDVNALNNLGADNARVVDTAGVHTSWMNDQLIKQMP